MRNFFLSIGTFMSEHYLYKQNEIYKPAKSVFFLNNMGFIFLLPIFIYTLIVNPQQIKSIEIVYSIISFFLISMIVNLLIYPLFLGNHIIIKDGYFINVEMVVKRTLLPLNSIVNVLLTSSGKRGEYNANLKVITNDGRETNINMFLYNKKDLFELTAKLGFPNVFNNFRSDKPLTEKDIKRRKAQKNKDRRDILRYVLNIFIGYFLLGSICFFVVVPIVVHLIENLLGLNYFELFYRILATLVLISGFRLEPKIDNYTKNMQIKKLILILLMMLVIFVISFVFYVLIVSPETRKEVLEFFNRIIGN